SKRHQNGLHPEEDVGAMRMRLQTERRQTCSANVLSGIVPVRSKWRLSCNRCIQQTVVTMFIKRIFMLALLLCILWGCSRHQTELSTMTTPGSEADIVKNFNKNISDLMMRYKAAKQERIEFDPYCGTTGRSGYIKAAYEPNPSYKVDVRKTDSLVS